VTLEFVSFRGVFQQVRRKKSLVKVLNNTFQNIKIMPRQGLNHCPYSLYPTVEVLDFCENGKNLSRLVIRAVRIVLRIALMIS
jgi:hypothetical protein